MNEIEYNATAKLINELFLEIKARCPAWPQSWPNLDIERRSKQIWLESLIKNKITNWEHVKIGLGKLRGSFVPPIDEFISLCKPTMEDYGLPQPFEAFRECCHNAASIRYNDPVTWSHQAVYHAGSQTGLMEIEKLKDLFLINYEIACKIVFEGGRLKDLPKLIPNKPEEKKDPEIALNSINKLKSMLGLK